MKYPRITFVAVAAVIVTLVLVGSGMASPAPASNGPEALGAVTIHPLRSTIANPSQLDTCVSRAIAYTNATYPEASGHPVVIFKKQIRDGELKKLAPRVGALTPDFGVLMNLVYLKGNFRATARTGGRAAVQYILLVLTPYPDCYVTVTAFGTDANPALVLQ